MKSPRKPAFLRFIVLLAGISSSGEAFIAVKATFKVRCVARTAHSEAAENAMPTGLKDVVVEALQNLGCGDVISVKDVTPGPGLHNRHFRYDTTRGSYMAKLSRRGSTQDFAAEAAGLEAIAATGCLRTPKALALGALPLGGHYLLLSHEAFIPFGQSIPEVLEQLAEGLAKMHLQPPPAETGGRYGFADDGWLGSGVQLNGWDDDLATFFVEKRLAPQFDVAMGKFKQGYGTSNEGAMAFSSLRDPVLEKARKILAPIRNCPPSLLHGDLWVGNCGAVPAAAAPAPAGAAGSGVGSSGGASRRRQAVVFDPACWYGPAEFDLALPSMFGGFGAPFYDVYHSLIPKEEGFDERQRIYRLYHYLNHLCLHGAGFGYGGSVERPQGYFERSVELMQLIAGRT